MSRKKGDKTCLDNLPNGSQSAKKHGLSALIKKFYNDDIERLIDQAKLPEELQRLISQHLEIMKDQPTFNEVTESLFKRLAFKAAWCDLAEEWFMANKLGAFWINTEGQFIGSHLAFQYKIFSESLARDYEKLGLLPDKGKKFQPVDFGSAMQEVK